MKRTREQTPFARSRGGDKSLNSSFNCVLYITHSSAMQCSLNMRSNTWRVDRELKSELWILAQLAWPLLVSNASDFFGKVLTVIFAGHFLTTDEFAAATLGNTMTNIAGCSMIIACVSPMDSLCTQANGAQNWTLYSLTVHRAFLCIALLSIPVIVLWLNMYQLLVLCGQDQEVAAYVAKWTLVYIAILPAYTIRTIGARFLSSQGIAQPLLWIGIVVWVI